MKFFLIISITLNVIAMMKWLVWRISFMGALCIYQEKYGMLSEIELEIIIRKALNCGIQNTVKDLSGRR